MNEKYLKILKRAINHIETIEGKKGLYSLGCTNEDIAEIQLGILNTQVDEKANINMIKEKIIYNDEVVLVLNDYGSKYIFSDQTETEDGWITECVPFKDHHHYIEIILKGDNSKKYVGYAWYNPKESYIEEFNDLNACLDWLTAKQ